MSRIMSFIISNDRRIERTLFAVCAAPFLFSVARAVGLVGAAAGVGGDLVANTGLLVVAGVLVVRR